MLRFFQPEKTNDNHYTLLINDLHQTAQDLQDAYRNLENVIDPDLIDCYIYELNSVQMRYKFLLTSIRNYESVSYTHLDVYKRQVCIHWMQAYCPFHDVHHPVRQPL